MKTILFSVFVFVFCTSGIFAQNTWYVFPDGSGDAPTIKAAVDSAASGDNILIYSGTYYEENILVDGKNINFSFDYGVPYITAPTPGNGTGMILRNVSNACLLFSLAFRDFDTAISIESGSPMIMIPNIKHCGSGVSVSGTVSAPHIISGLIDSCTTGFEIQQGADVRISRHTIVNCASGIVVSGGTVTVGISILYGCVTGVACSGGTLTFDCNDFWNNTTDYSGCTPGPLDFYEDPMFCFLAGGSPDLYYLHKDSPCWAENNACSADIGAYNSMYGCEGPAVKESSWGKIKAIVR